MSEAWEDILMEMDSKLLKFAEDKKVSYSQCSKVNIKYCRFLVKILVKILLLLFDSCELYKIMIKVWHMRQLLSLLFLIQKGEIRELHVSTSVK